MHRPPFDHAMLCDIAAEAIGAEAADCDLAQDIRGVDGLAELDLHRILQRAFAGAGYGVHPETHYPARVGRKRSEGDRCDIVLTRNPGEPLMDPAEAGTLFESSGVRPDDACWIEVKCVHQHALIAGVARTNPGYAGLLGGPVAADVRRLASDPAINCAALLLLLFAESDAVGAHDLEAWANRCLDRGLPIAAPCARRIPITDRIGNRMCLVTMTPIRAAISGRSARAG